jgi:general secretion pathway protein C
MGLDSQLKRFFPFVVCALIALAAYFQAAGIGDLVASSVAAGAAVAPPADGLLASTRGPQHTGDPILARNPFDSITGPLDGRVAAQPAPQESTPSPDGEPTGEDPPCKFGRVLLISASEDPAWSFASIEEKGGERKLRRAGDDVGGHTLQAMAWDRVWLAQGTKRCQMKLGDKSKAPAKATAKKPRKPRKKRRNSRQLAPELVAKITKVSDTEFRIERSMVDELLQNQATLMRSARVVPEKGGGIRLMRIREGTLLSHLGMKNGDVLRSINGFDMGDPQKALEAYGRLRTADKLSVQVNRKGKPTTLDFHIQ